MKELLTIAIHTAQKAGDEIMKLYDSTEFETKIDGSPVTVADHLAHKIITEQLQATGISILSEESDGVPLPYPTRMWIIDPIDGTTGFIKSTGDFSIMIGLIENGIPILGVVYAPAHTKLLYAYKGGGAFIQNEHGAQSLLINNTPHTPPRFVCSSNHFTPDMEKIFTYMHALKKPIGGIGIKMSIIAENNGEFFFTHAQLGEWDVCAPHIILQEAGGIVTDCLGMPLVYGTKNHHIERGVVFSHKAYYAQLCEALKHSN
jgi:3'(2'), 5'-bisphosphate nucleotidase